MMPQSGNSVKHLFVGADDGTRTRVSWLATSGATPTPHPRKPNHSTGRRRWPLDTAGGTGRPLRSTRRWAPAGGLAGHRRMITSLHTQQRLPPGLSPVEWCPLLDSNQSGQIRSLTSSSRGRGEKWSGQRNSNPRLRVGSPRHKPLYHARINLGTGGGTRTPSVGFGDHPALPGLTGKNCARGAAVSPPLAADLPQRGSLSERFNNQQYPGDPSNHNTSADRWVGVGNRTPSGCFTGSWYATHHSPTKSMRGLHPQTS